MTGQNVVAAAQALSILATDDVRATRVGSKPWQQEAWTYFDELGEIKFGCRFKGAALSRIRPFAGFIVNPDEPPVDIVEAAERGEVPMDIAVAAQDQLARLGSADEQSELMRDFGVILSVSGDSHLIGEPDDMSLTGERWAVYSDQAVVANTESPYGIGIRTSPVASSRPVPAEALPIHTWIQHPAWPDLPDANMRAVLAECEELLIYARQFRAVGKSRSSAGVWYIANEIGDMPDTPGKPTSWETTLMKSLAKPVTDDSDPTGVIPHIVRGPAYFGTGNKAIPAKDAFFRLELDRKIDEKAIERVMHLIQRIAHGLDVPVEVLTGIADVNHWSAWQIEDTTYKAHIEPLAMVPAHAFTTSLLRPELINMFGRIPILRRVVVGMDPGDLVTRPNQTINALALYDRWLLSGDATRGHLGFSDNEAPTDEEIALRLEIEQAVGGSTGQTEGGGEPDGETSGDSDDVTDDQPIPDQQASAASPRSNGHRPTMPARPGTSRPSMRLLRRRSPAAATLVTIGADQADQVANQVAAAAVSALGDDLARIDSELRSRVVLAASEAVNNAVRAVAKRLRSRAQGDPEQAEAVRGAIDDEVAQALAGAGGDVSDVEQLAAEQFDHLHERWDRWVTIAYDDVSELIRDHAADDAQGDIAVGQLRAQEDQDRDAGWLVLAAALAGIVHGRLFTPDGTPDDGEFDSTIDVQHGAARAAMARAGGIATPGLAPAGFAGELGPGSTIGGIATGQHALVALRTVGLAVAQWVWDVGRPTTPFPPHHALAGITFSRWDDPLLANAGVFPPFGSYFPGDHAGCQCDAVPVMALIEG